MIARILRHMIMVLESDDNDSNRCFFFSFQYNVLYDPRQHPVQKLCGGVYSASRMVDQTIGLISLCNSLLLENG